MKGKKILMTALIAVVAVAIVNRVPLIRDKVFGTGA